MFALGCHLKHAKKVYAENLHRKDIKLNVKFSSTFQNCKWLYKTLCFLPLFRGIKFEGIPNGSSGKYFIPFTQNTVFTNDSTTDVFSQSVFVYDLNKC